MTDRNSVDAGWHKLGTSLTHAGRATPPEAGTYVNPPLERGSTVLFPSLKSMNRKGQERYDHTSIYGAMGSPTQHELEKLIARIEGGTDCQIVSSGLAACTTPLLAFLKAGDHCLLADSVYGPTRRFAENMLKRFGVDISYFPPCASRAEVEEYIQPNTRIIFTESPGSHTFEVQDIPMLAEVAHQHGARLFLDNTWGFGIFAPFEHGVDVSIQALTKYPSGHSDVIAGAITVADQASWHILRDASIQLGQVAGPDECWLTLRGLRTMGVRLAQQARSALQVATWLKQRPEVAQVLHPALPDCPGHNLWKRDFTGAGCLFGVVLNAPYTCQNMERMINAMRLFGIGASWGGYESLVLPTTGGITRSFGAEQPESPAFRLQIGLENAQDLIDDLDQAFNALHHTA
ncbi:cystathionine beta-lyase [Acetobacter fabarum]|uniref:Cystathionine beta-lyase n=1 Tax=Acetobacter fabarum TaxID=483199 RepID=A0A269Y128_9PROT|nr:cystathionine beta-lyase [Acetobacter fabarum]PAK79199.1 cystathionine beta-lyase [Acetobacter fabarum]